MCVLYIVHMYENAENKEYGNYIKLSLIIRAPAAYTAVTAERKRFRLYSETLRVQVQGLFALRG